MIRPIDQIYKYLEAKSLTAFEFEQKSGLSNAYLSRQKKGNGVIGSEMLVRILNAYPRLSMMWLLFGFGDMEIEEGEGSQVRVQKDYLHTQSHTQSHTQPAFLVNEASSKYNESELEKQNEALRKQVALLEASNADKSRLIEMLDAQLKRNKTGSKG